MKQGKHRAFLFKLPLQQYCGSTRSLLGNCALKSCLRSHARPRVEADDSRLMRLSSHRAGNRRETVILKEEEAFFEVI